MLFIKYELFKKYISLSKESNEIIFWYSVIEQCSPLLRTFTNLY
jgi:hypothetical protein